MMQSVYLSIEKDRSWLYLSSRPYFRWVGEPNGQAFPILFCETVLFPEAILRYRDYGFSEVPLLSLHSLTDLFTLMVKQAVCLYPQAGRDRPVGFFLALSDYLHALLPSFYDHEERWIAVFREVVGHEGFSVRKSQDYAQWLSLPPKIRSVVDRVEIPLSVALAMKHLTEKECQVLRDWIDRFSIGSHTAKKLIVSILEIKAMVQKDLSLWLESLAGPKSNLASIEEKIFQKRYPVYGKRYQKARRIVQSLAEKGLAISFPYTFENNEMIVPIKIKTKKDVDSIGLFYEKVQRYRKEIEALLELLNNEVMEWEEN